MSGPRYALVNRWLPIVITLFTLWVRPANAGQNVPVLEASGVSRLDDWVLIVDDEQPGGYFRFQLGNEKGPLFLLHERQLEWVPLPQANLATDLEAIDLLADGRVAVLSERLRALFGADGIIAEYDAPLSEFGKRGLEGLAVRRLEDKSSWIAVLWEGGYPEYVHVPEQLRNRVGRMPLDPLVHIHRLAPEETGILIRGAKYIRLDVPVPGGRGPRAQRFRAPDLVWYRFPDGKWGFIVILSSLNSMGTRQYMYHWLQRFSATGKRIGEPLDLDRVMPEAFRGANWEGLAWFEEGQSLVIVHESHPKANAAARVVELPEDWKFAKSGEHRFTHLLKRETEYYLGGPQQARPPDGTLPAGTKVALLRKAGSYSLVRTDGNLEAYVASSSLKRYSKE